MRARLFFCLLFALGCAVARAAPAPIEGFWQITDNRGTPQSIAVVYGHDGLFFCRMIAIYDDKTGKLSETAENATERAKGIKGKPLLVGLDFIWNLKPGNGRHYRGTVINPDDGHTYVCKVWYDEQRKKLAVRGELLLFGQNQYWPPVDPQNLPETLRVQLDKLVPEIPPN